MLLELSMPALGNVEAVGEEEETVAGTVVLAGAVPTRGAEVVVG